MQNRISAGINGQLSPSLAIPLVSIVIPTHNRREKLKRLIDSILSGDYDNVEILVIDDASTDGTAQEVRRLYPVVEVIQNQKPMLVSACRNLGLRKAKGEFVLFADDDNVFDEHTISSLVDVLGSYADVGVVAPLMFFLDDPRLIWCAGVKRSLLTSKTTILGHKRAGETNEELVESEDFPNVFMVSRSIAHKVGGFDSNAFPMHYEEADFGQKIRAAGYRLVMNPKSKTWHDISNRRRDYGGLELLHLKSAQRAFFVSRNRVVFMKRHAGPARFLLFYLIFYPGLSALYLGAILRSRQAQGFKRRLFTSYLRGMLDGLKWRK